jgi:ferredoxin
MAKKPYVDQDACISCNLCADTVPEVFRMNDLGLAEVYDPAGASEAKIQEAIDTCPVACISWQD